MRSDVLYGVFVSLVLFGLACLVLWVLWDDSNSPSRTVRVIMTLSLVVIISVGLAAVWTMLLS